MRCSATCRRPTTVFTDIAAHVLFGANLAFHNQTLNGQGVLVSGSYFPVLGLTPAIGRLLSPQDDQKLGESLVVVLSHAYWTSRFDRNPSVIGDTLIVNGQHLTIVGVAPEGFDGTTLGAKPQVFVPITLRGLMNPGFNQFHNRRSYWAYLFARLRPGATIEQARTQLNVPYRAIINDVEAPLQRGMSDQTMARFKARQVVLEPGARGQTSVDREARVPLLLLLSVTGLVLLIACANIANLLLARAAARSSEMAIRLSIGANRRQLIGQLLTESVVLAVIGGLAGLLVSRWTLDLIFAMLPNEAAETLQVKIDGTVLLFAAGGHHRHRPALRAVPRLAQHQPQPADHAQGPGRSAGRRKIRQMVPRVAGDGPDRDLDGAAGLRRTLHQEPDERQPRRARHQRRAARHVWRLAGAERLLGRAIEAAVRAARRRAGGAARVSPASRASLVPALGGSNWGTDVAVRGIQGGAGHRHATPATTRSHRTISRRWAFRCSPGANSRAPTRLGGPKVAIVNEAFAKKFNLGTRRGRQADGRRRRADRQAGHRDRRRWRRTPSTARSRTRFRRSSSGPTGRTSGSARSRSTCAPSGAPEQIIQTIQRAGGERRSEPAGREPPHHGAAGPRQRLPRSDDQHDVGRLRGAGDAARGGRPLRRARLYGRAAHPRDRAADGARRRAEPRAGDGAPAGRRDDADRRRRRAGGRRLGRPRGEVHPLSDGGARSAGARPARSCC